MLSRQKLLKYWYTKMLHIVFLLCVKYIFFLFYRSIRFKAKGGVRTCKDYVIGSEITTILKIAVESVTLELCDSRMPAHM